MAYAAAQQRQLREHYAEAYDGDGVTDEVRVVAAVADARPDEVLVRLEPSAAAPDELGVHDRLDSGCPVIRVFLDLAVKFGDAWQSIASHEVLETRADPRLHACVELDDGTIWDREICDRVEADGYEIDGVPLSNFNTPACFEPSGIHGERFDYLGKSTWANEVRPGGYAQEYDPQRGWQMIGAMRGYRAELAARALSRGERRARRAAAFRDAVARAKEILG